MTMSEQQQQPLHGSNVIKHVLIVHGGELASDVAQQLAAAAGANHHHGDLAITVQSAAERPTDKWLQAYNKNDTVVCFVMQTIEHAAPTEEGGTTMRYWKRKTHSANSLSFCFAVLGLGDSNLLLDRQTTTAKDCNQVAQYLDGRLAELGAVRHHALGLADERTGLTSVVEPWIQSFWASI